MFILYGLRIRSSVEFLIILCHVFKKKKKFMSCVFFNDNLFIKIFF